MTVKYNQNAMKQMAYNKYAVIPNITLMVFYIAMIALPFSLMRAFKTGWQPIYSFEIACVVAIGILCLYRNKVSPIIQAWVMVTFDILIASYCLLTFGIASSGVVISLACVLFCMFFISARAALVVGLVFLSIYVVVMYQFVVLGREIPIDEKIYMAAFSSWATMLFGSVFFTVKLMLGIYNQQRHSMSLLTQLEERNSVIETQRADLEKLANHDHLTGLPSLRLAHKQLELVLSKSKQFDYHSALFYMDLDGFKTINDKHGHSVGDSVLIETAVRITSEIREGDIACRIGGDEFIIIINKVEDSHHIEKLCVRLINTINQPVIVEGRQLKVGVSIGAITYSKSSDDDAKSLLDKADGLMYGVKASGKNSYKLAC